ncbi:MAG TPA: DinB family protein [Terriglobales bacterium]
MIRPWTERKFNFDVAVAHYPNVLARYRGTPARLQDAVQGLRREQLTARIDGKWSIQENVGHLLDEEALFTTRLKEYLAGARTLTPAPYLHLESAHNNQSIEEILAAFRMARLQQVERLSTLRLDDFARTAWHARLQINMRLIDHLLFVAEHDDHHLARIWELRNYQRHE